MTVPTPPAPLRAEPGEVRERLLGARVTVPDRVRSAIASSGAEVLDEESARLDASRDWWPLAIGWASEGLVPARPGLVVRPANTEQVVATLAHCQEAGIPVTPMAGRSGVCGGAVPAFGGIALDLSALTGVISLDEESLVADVRAGTFGPDLEAALRARGSGYTLGHWPQSIDLSTVGGWLACRSAGQYSTRYGKIEDMVVGLTVVLADGRIVKTEGGGPRAATGPNLTQLFVGSEGTLGVITAATLRVHPVPGADGRRAYAFDTFDGGVDACRRILRRGATPAVLRLYDPIESQRQFECPGICVLVVLDEGDRLVVDATLSVVDEECSDPGRAGAAAAEPLDEELVERWLAHRNDVSALAPLWQAGVVVDTAEVAGLWGALPSLAYDVLGTLRGIEGTLVASVHQSHAYSDGACLYFTFAGRRPDSRRGGVAPGDLAWEEAYYRQAWDLLTHAVRRNGAVISHHHGIGLNRSRFLPDALGTGFDVLVALKEALDPAGILNPGKLGLPSRLGPVRWP